MGVTAWLGSYLTAGVLTWGVLGSARINFQPGDDGDDGGSVTLGSHPGWAVMAWPVWAAAAVVLLLLCASGWVEWRWNDPDAD